MDDIVAHVPEPGDQISAGNTALAVSMPSTRLPPPVTSTVPSGSDVRVWNARRNPMAPVGCHCGEGRVMSRTNAVFVAKAVETPTSAALPDFMSLPGWYCTTLWPSIERPSTTLHVWLARSRTRVGMAVRTDPAESTRPSGSAKICG